MNCNTEIKNVFVTSENRDKNLYPYGNSYVLHLTTPIKDVCKVELINASVPNSIYNLTEGSNVFVTNVNSTVNVFSLTPGYYSGSSLATELTQTISNITNITVQYIPHFGKMVFLTPNSVSSFSVQSNSAELSTLLGVSNATPIYGTSSTAPTDEYIPLYWDHTRYRNKLYAHSNVICDFHANEGIFLDVEELRTIFNEDAKSITGDGSGTYSGKNISRSFGLISMDVNSGEIKNFKKNSDYDLCIEYPQVLNKIDRLTVRWTDRHNELINFNGIDDNSFLLRFHTLRRNLC